MLKTPGMRGSEGKIGGYVRIQGKTQQKVPPRAAMGGSDEEVAATDGTRGELEPGLLGGGALASLGLLARLRHFAERGGGYMEN